MAVKAKARVIKFGLKSLFFLNKGKQASLLPRYFGHAIIGSHSGGRNCQMALQIPRKLKTAVLLLFLALTLTAAGGGVAALAQAESEPSPVNVIIDGEIIEFDVEPQIIAGRTLVPMRGIFEHLGAEVFWHEETRRVTARRELDEQAVSLTIGSLWAVVNGEDVELDAPPMLYGNRTLIPMRFVAESFGADVW